MKKYFPFLIAILALAACDKSHDFIRDNASPTGLGYAPVSNNTLQNVVPTPPVNLGTSAATATAFAAGATFRTELQYFSQSPVKEIQFYNTIGAGTRTQVAVYPYASAFSQSKRLDTLLIPYTIPTAASGTVIKLEIDILNENGLRLPAPKVAYVKVQ
ncbi:MAG: hypothetical protein ABS85_12025 [Sphingobacteriales bacterium SCN 48-20]|jgi:hypothetical protein|uniref:hypothetical protein n=1 Tax=Terrimonas ferruginea TaxID=249 RepID=UPI00086B2186|nr:hypothetical protein [Terrimonas ferruginea]MBN8782098.1 hypothetical protein [Terrimonas ferruginea]ODT91646.1 MAG: hypothetical protein ABS85_12025 [Sphingobacteriales bacterium SCN 48-20]OJW42644.1 MAG: hypothetical protein BGO56_11330 [Sphingobacteriales bacterium 48-107]